MGGWEAAANPVPSPLPVPGLALLLPPAPSVISQATRAAPQWGVEAPPGCRSTQRISGSSSWLKGLWDVEGLAWVLVMLPGGGSVWSSALNIQRRKERF